MKLAAAVTAFGDLALLLPLALGILVWLGLHRANRAAIAWTLSVAFCGGSTAALKIVFLACGSLPTVASPSGHTSLGVLVYGAIATICVFSTRGWARLPVLTIFSSLVIGIAWSRYALAAHGILEVAVGMAIGLATLAVFAYHYLHNAPATPRLWLLLKITAATLVILYGQQLPTEQLLNLLGLRVRAAIPACT